MMGATHGIAGLLAQLFDVLVLGAIVSLTMLYYEGVALPRRRSLVWAAVVFAALCSAFAPKVPWLWFVFPPIELALLAVVASLLAPRKRGTTTLAAAVILGAFAALVVFAMTAGMAMPGMKM
ncbi:MAG TPA: hypothetical protein VIG51_05875 [Candidatus Baltobacteraceae bacterium]|jgi:hypothetical protein